MAVQAWPEYRAHADARKQNTSRQASR